MPNKNDNIICCSFCGKSEGQAQLIAGPGVYICSDCVAACSDLLREEYEMENGTGLNTPDRLPTPMEMKSFMDHYIIGQDEAIDNVVRAIRRNRAGIKDPNKPIGTFIFFGPTGVGKTQLAKSLADYLFDSEENMIRLDMS